MGKEKGLDYMRRLARRMCKCAKATRSWRSSWPRAKSLWPSSSIYSNRVEGMKISGAPIEWVRFKGPTITAINAISIPEKAPHPDAARLFIDFVLSRDGQNLLRGLRRIPARADVFPDPPGLTNGLNLYAARPEGMVENYNDTVARFDEIFNKSK